MKDFNNAKALISALNENLETLLSMNAKISNKCQFEKGLREISLAIEVGKANTFEREQRITIHEKTFEEVALFGYLLEKGFLRNRKSFVYEWYLEMGSEGRESEKETLKLFINKVLVEEESMEPLIKAYFVETEQEDFECDETEDYIDDDCLEATISEERRAEIIEEIIEDSCRKIDLYERGEKVAKFGALRCDFVSRHYGAPSIKEFMEYLRNATVSDGERVLLILDFYFDKIIKILPSENRKIFESGFCELMHLYELAGRIDASVQIQRRNFDADT